MTTRKKTRNVPFSVLRGRTLRSVTVSADREVITFVCEDGTTYRMKHDQDCNESVTLEDVNGDWATLLGEPILMADESSRHEEISETESREGKSETWTFYKLATIKGYVDLRWYGTSNGYYSEEVRFMEVLP